MISRFYKTVTEYLNNNLKKKGELFYFGDIYERSSTQSPDEIASMLEIDGNHRGYLVINLREPYHQVSLACDEETLYANIFRDQTIIKIKPHRVTRDIPVHSQAISKDDWVNVPGIEIKIESDFNIHRKRMESASRRFNKSNKSSLWLPNFVLS